MTVRRSPLDAEHRALAARMVPFGGWEMPLAYPAGTVAEHRACRTAAVAFDVSHLGTVLVSGEGSVDVLQHALTNDLGRIAPGRAQYTHLLDDADGSVLDDLIVWWVGAHDLHVMPNASNTDRVLGVLKGEDGPGGRPRVEDGPGGRPRVEDGPGGRPRVEDITATRAVVAVQGPAARERLATVAPEAAAVGRFRVATFSWRGIDCLAAGTGYTGEDGVECAVPAEAAASFWGAVLGAGVNPAGLGARDTLRLEAGLPLHGHELGPGITPLQAGLEWVVAWDKGDFRGRKALEAERDAGVPRLLRGLVLDGRQPPRAGQAVLDADGTVVGEVTSGNFSPMLERGIALAFLPPAMGEGAVVSIDVRGHVAPAQVVRTPFVARR